MLLKANLLITAIDPKQLDDSGIFAYKRVVIEKVEVNIIQLFRENNLDYAYYVLNGVIHKTTIENLEVVK